MQISLSSIIGFSAIAILTGLVSTSSLEKDKIHAIIEDRKEIFDAISTVNITQTLSLYGFALDGKNYSALEYVFTRDAVVREVSSSVVGLSELEKFYEQTLGNIKTLHTSANVLVFNITDKKATALSDEVVVYFGNSNRFFKNTTIPVLDSTSTLTFFERFEDQFRRGDDGIWRIWERQQTTLVSVVDRKLGSPSNLEL